MDAVGAVTAGLGEAAKAAGRRALASICHRTGLARARLRGRVVILGYHRVLTPGDRAREFVQPGMYVEPGELAAHLEYLRRHFRVLALEDLLARWADGDWDPAARYCAITFDDGWRDNYVHAFPVLRALGVPATIFVATAFVGTRERFWTDTLAACLRAYRAVEARRGAGARLRHLRTAHPWLAGLPPGVPDRAIDAALERAKLLPDEARSRLLADLQGVLEVTPPPAPAFLGWPEIHEMSAQGVAFGSHSCTHRILTRLGPAEVRREAEASLAALRASGARVVPVFCHPNGDASAATVDAVRASGYRAAIGGEIGLEAARPSDLFRLRRIPVHHDVARTVPLFALRLADLGRLGARAAARRRDIPCPARAAGRTAAP